MPGYPVIPKQDEDAGVREGSGVTLIWLPVAMNGELRWIPMSLTRREILAAGGAAALAPWLTLLDLGEQGRLGAVISGQSRPDIRMVGHLEVLLAEYRRLDDLSGPRHVHGLVQSTLKVIDDWTQTARPPVRQALVSISAQYEQLNGWLWADRGNHAMARHSYDRAIARATESAGSSFMGYLLTCKSSEALKEENAPSAIALAQEAQAGRWGLTPAVRALAAAREARARALAGESAQCERKLDEAHKRLVESAEKDGATEPPWIYWFVEEEFPIHRGLCYTALGWAQAAIAVFEDASTKLPAEFVRDRGECLSWLARAHARNNDPEQAARVALESAHIAIGTGSTGILEDLRGLSEDLGTSGNLQAAEELGELLESSAAQGL